MKQSNIVPKKPAAFILAHSVLTVAVVYGYAFLQGEGTRNAEALDLLLQFQGGLPSLHGLCILLEKLSRGHRSWLGYGLAIYVLPILLGLLLPLEKGLARREILSYAQGAAILFLVGNEKGESR